MMLCNCDPDDPLHVIGFVAGGIRGGILLLPLPFVAGYVCDFLSAVAPGGLRPTSPSPSCLFAVSLSRPPAQPIRQQSVSQIAVVDDCSKLFSPLHCLSLLSPSVSTSAISLNPRLPVTAWPPSGKRWKTDNRNSKSPP